MAKERIHAWLAKQGVASRRASELLVRSQEVLINGKLAVIGQPVDGSDRVVVSGKLIVPKQSQTRLLMFHKKVGWVCSRKPQDKQVSIFDFLPKLNTGRWILVGRLDINTSGLILVTNDGQLANHLTHPSSGFLREYLVRVNGVIDQECASRLTSGVRLEDGRASFQVLKPQGKSKKGTNHWYRVGVSEGKNRLVRRLFESQRFEVSRLMRVAFGPFVLPKTVAVGQNAEYSATWIDQFRAKRGW